MNAALDLQDAATEAVGRLTAAIAILLSDDADDDYCKAVVREQLELGA